MIIIKKKRYRGCKSLVSTKYSFDRIKKMRAKMLKKVLLYNKEIQRIYNPEGKYRPARAREMFIYEIVDMYLEYLKENMMDDKPIIGLYYGYVMGVFQLNYKNLSREDMLRALINSNGTCIIPMLLTKRYLANAKYLQGYYIDLFLNKKDYEKLRYYNINGRKFTNYETAIRGKAYNPPRYFGEIGKELQRKKLG